MTECAQIRKLLALQRADWSAEEKRRVEAHLAGCEQCAAAARAYAEQDRWSRAMPPVALTPAQRNQVLTQARTAGPRPARVRLSTAVAGAALVAVVGLLALGLAALFHQRAQQQAITGRDASSPLAGTEWTLTALDGKALIEGTYIGLYFESDRLGGFAGCNAYGGGPDSGSYLATEDGDFAVPQLAITVMDCGEPPGVMEQEEAYVEALRSAAAYRVVDDRLELADDSGQTILRYARQPEFQGNPADLPGTAWQLVSLDGESPVGSRPITLAFQLAGEATGHAGCRDYRVTYEATGGDLRFLSTEMSGDVCGDQALLEQEGEYTTILGWTRHYRLTPGRLELFTARGETLAFIAMPTGSGGDAPTPAPTVATPPAGSELGKLAWVQDGDVWIRVLPDGEPIRLTDDGRNSLPRWSPSGEWLAYRKDTQVWLVRANGQDAYALDGGGVIDAFAWAPTNDRLAYVAGSGILRLEVLRAGETAPLRLLPPSGDGQPGRIAWSPDGAWIAYEWRQAMAYQGLCKIPAGGGEPVELYDSGVGQGGEPQPGEALLAGWTADGSYLLFWQGEMLSASLLADGAPFYALPADGGQPVLLAGESDDNLPGGGDVMLYHDDFWSSSPGGRYLALTVGGGRETWTNKRIAVADAATGQLQTYTDGTVAAFSPLFSPGNAQIAYVAGPDVGFVGGGQEGRAAVFQRHIWVMGDDALSSGNGPVLRQLTDDAAYRDERPLWSADGSHILFVRMDQQEQVSLWLLPGVDDKARQVAGGLGPLPGPDTGWFGYYGHIDWDTLYDWWSGPASPGAPDQDATGK